MKFLLLIKAWCKEKKIQTPIEQMMVGQLDVNFRRFYAEARNKAGEPYSKSTLLGFRHSFERYLNRPPFNQGLNLSSDPRFKRSNEMLNAQIVHLKRQGKENVKHKPAIEDEDLKKLKTSQAIALTSPLTLLQNVWFHVVLFFCRRGREGNSKGQVSDLKLMPLEDSSSQWRTMKQPKIILEDLVKSRAMKSWQG